MFCPVIPAAFGFVFNPVNHFSVYLALSAKAVPYSLFFWCPLSDWSHLPCWLLLPLPLSTVHLLIPNSREGWKNIFCSSYWSLGLRFELLLCLIWWNRAHIAQCRFLFEKDICLLLHIFFPLHSTVQIISFGEISTFVGKKAEIVLLQQILKDIILNHWIRAFSDTKLELK